MKIALLSDIHGNIDALEAVLKEAKTKEVEQLLICGDFVGYYYFPDKVLSKLDEWSWTCVRGNHEDYLRELNEKGNSHEYKSKYGSGLNAALQVLTDEQVKYLVNLPSIRRLTVANKNILLCHGSPWNIDDYIYPDANEETCKKITSYDEDVVVFGHTHHPVLWENNNKFVINPGSVGQPRDKLGGACWVLWCTESMTFEFMRVKYDYSCIINECQQRDPSLKLLVKNFV